MALEIPWDWNDEKNMFSKWEGVRLIINYCFI